MAQTKYTKSIASDTLNGAVDSDKLTLEIQNSTITIALDFMSILGDVLDIYFKNVLSASEQTELSTVLGAHDGVTDIPEETVHALVDSQPPFASKTLADGRKIYKRVHGVSGNIPANSTSNIDFTVPYTESKFTGAEMFGVELGDTINFKILDDANGTYSTVPNYLLNQFGFDVQMPSGGDYKNTSNYDASLYVGMIIRCEYTNNGGTAKDVSMNAWLHEVV